MNWAREILVTILILIIIIFTISILFYDCLPFSEERVKSIKYEADEKVKTIMAEVENKSIVKTEEEAKTIKIYNVDKTELTVYSEEGYETGKKNPFEEVSENLEETVTTEVTEGETLKANSSNSGESTGTFFENKNSK